MIKVIGTSGQISLGKHLAGKHFRLDVHADGTLVLVPVKIVTEAELDRLTAAQAPSPRPRSKTKGRKATRKKALAPSVAARQASKAAGKAPARTPRERGAPVTAKSEALLTPAPQAKRAPRPR